MESVTIDHTFRWFEQGELDRWLEEKGITLQKLAEATDLPIDLLECIKRGVPSCDSILTRIARTFEVTLEQLVNSESKPVESTNGC